MVIIPGTYINILLCAIRARTVAYLHCNNLEINLFRYLIMHGLYLLINCLGKYRLTVEISGARRDSRRNTKLNLIIKLGRHPNAPV